MELSHYRICICRQFIFQGLSLRNCLKVVSKTIAKLTPSISSVRMVLIAAPVALYFGMSKRFKAMFAMKAIKLVKA